MRTRMTLVVVCCVTLWLSAAVRFASGAGSDAGAASHNEVGGGMASLNSAFTYQGQLLLDGAPVSGTCDLQFELWDAATGGALAAATQTRASVEIRNGLFTLELDFGSLAFNGGARWLQIAARCPTGSGTYEYLTPRQTLTAVPYALYAQSVPWGGLTDGQALELKVDSTRIMRLELNPVSPNVIAGYRTNSVSTDVAGATIGGGGASGAANQVTDQYGTVGGGSQNQAGNGDAWVTNVPYASVSGGEHNLASGSHALVSGGEANTASGSHATVGGGLYNVASGYASTVGGGGGFDDVIGTPLSNTAAGRYSTVGGGVSNTADGFAAVVGGGESNTVSGEDAVVSGGWQNSAGGLASVVPGGEGNAADGGYSLAAGRNATADHQGAFVWADSTDALFASQRDDQFRVRANGGARFDVNNGVWVNIWNAGNGRVVDTSTGAFLSQGGMWTNSSDRAQKENLTPVNGQEILHRLSRVPISTWNYQAESPSIQHIGPTAQDLYAVFRLGQDDTHIGTVDADGIALAAIQGLYQLSQEQAARISQLEEKNVALEGRLAALEALVAHLAGAAE